MLRQITDTLGPLPEDVFRRAETEIGVPLPEPYKQFLQQFNGGRPEPARFRIEWREQPFAKRFPYDGVHVLFGFQDGSPSDFLRNLQDYRARIPEDTVPIGCDPGGNLLLLGLTGPNAGKVFLWVQDYEVEEGETPDYSNVGLIAPSFDEFLRSLYDK